MSGVAVIVQARMGSTRLPGKVLKDIVGQTVLAHVLGRVLAIPGADHVVCAVPDAASNDSIASEARRLGVRVYRGDDTDVLGRYHSAAQACGADVIMRITSDCPLIDPSVSGRVLERFYETGAAYCSNLAPRSWPKGLDTEVFSTDVLEKAAASATEQADREHVTPWIRRNQQFSHGIVVNADGDFSGLRWTLDYPEDLSFFRALYAKLPPPPAVPSFAEVLATAQAHPEIVALNAHLK